MVIFKYHWMVIPQNTKINPIHKTIALYKLTRTKALFTTITKRNRIKAHIMLQSSILAKPTPLLFIYFFSFYHVPKAKPIESHKFVTDPLIQSKPSQVSYRPAV